MSRLFSNQFYGKKVLVTGHTGFKGSWLCLWLQSLGAEIIGLSLEPDTNPSHYNLLNLDLNSIIGDIRDQSVIDQVIRTEKPEIIFHLAAQPLVKKSYRDPLDTYQTNVIGLIHLYEACRKSTSVKYILNVTTDKCYENNEWVWGYRENEPLGGYDPYSASKACSEIITSSYKRSFFHEQGVLLASARAGNVIGGGDWAEDRLFPDMISSIINKEVVEIRSPHATRPWQHVLEPLSGYLLLMQKLIQEGEFFAEAYNFGPDTLKSLTVKEVVEIVHSQWSDLQYSIPEIKNKVHEAGALKLDCSKAMQYLEWENTWYSETSVVKAVHWYKNFQSSQNAEQTQIDLNDYITDAKAKDLIWTKN